METFQNWLEFQSDPNATVYYDPSGENKADTTASITHEPTVGQNQNQGQTQMIDPDISQTVQALDQIHGNLGSIFTRMYNKTNAFRSKSIKSAFDRELTTAIDSVNRSKIILYPSAKGIDGE